MPYIQQEDRKYFDHMEPNAQTPGELNYLVTDLIKRYMKVKGLNYQTINDVIGALEGAKLEFYARIARPYEDKKILLNGDVYE